MTSPAWDDKDGDEEEMTPENMRKAREELVRMGLIVDSGERRNGQILWITAEEAVRRKRG